MNGRRSSLPTISPSTLTTSNEKPRRPWLIASFSSTRAKKTGKPSSPEAAEAKGDGATRNKQDAVNSTDNLMQKHASPDKLRRARRRQELAAKALQRQSSKSQVKDSCKTEDWRRRSSSSIEEDGSAELTLGPQSGMNDSMRGNLEIASLVPTTTREQEQQQQQQDPPYRPRRRLKLSRKANRRFVSELEVLEWQSEKQTLCVHKNSLESQRMALRNLRATSRQLQRPFERCYLTLEQATRDQTMFSIIPEQCSNLKQPPVAASSGATNRVLTDPRPALSDIARETQALAQLDNQRQETDLVLTDRYARLILTQHNQHQNQNTGLERCMDILRYVSERRGVDDDGEEEEEEVQDDERSTFTTTTGCLTIDFLEDEASSFGTREESKWETNSITSYDASEKSQQSASSFSSDHPPVPGDSNDNNNNLVVTDHFANLIMAKHQQRAGRVRRASQSGMEVLQSISGSFRLPLNTTNYCGARKTTTRRQSTGSASSAQSLVGTTSKKCINNTSLEVTDHFANLIMAKHQEHVGNARRASRSGMEVLQSISASFRLPPASSLEASLRSIEV